MKLDEDPLWYARTDDDDWGGPVLWTGASILALSAFSALVRLIWVGCEAARMTIGLRTCGGQSRRASY